MDRVRILTALHALLQRVNPDAHVIFVDRRTGKFVQFAGSAQDGLFLDLPTQPLDPVEGRRAEEFFRGLGVKAVEYDLGERRQKVFQMHLGRDVETATNLVENVFNIIYILPHALDLVVTER
ncbi:MAG: hypothetical protein K2X82_20345 [Gemmataceae bacterium]|nr:hypothetical protein [Gemmataceae bacterium]